MGKPTYKNDIVKSYCEKYPNASTTALARIINSECPIDFPSFDTTRSSVRYVRGEKADKNKNSEYKRSEVVKKQFMKRNFELPDSDYKKVDVFKIPKGQNNILILSDIHLPYQDNAALATAIQYGIENKVNAVLLNGDTIDMYQVSRFIKDRRLRDMAGELEITRKFLKTLQDTFNCPIYFKIGNHEARWENYLRLQAPELLGIPDFELSTILRLREFGVTEVKDKQRIMAGKLSILHGHEFGHSVFSPVNPARGLYMRAKENSIIGHHHQTSEHSEKSLSGDVATTWSVGCLCGLEPDYQPYNKYNHGFAHVQTSDNGGFSVKNIRIINGKIA